LLRLAVACTYYGAAEKKLRQLMAYEPYGGLQWLMAAARGSYVGEFLAFVS